MTRSATSLSKCAPPSRARADRVDELVAGAVDGDVTGGAGQDGGQDAVLPGAWGEHEHPGGGGDGANAAADGGAAVEVWAAHAEEDDVGPEALDLGDGVVAEGELADDLHVRGPAGAEGDAQARPQELAVLNERQSHQVVPLRGVSIWQTLPNSPSADSAAVDYMARMKYP